MEPSRRRAEWHDVWLSAAEAVAERSSCTRSQVGTVVVVDNYWTYVGYNGPAPRQTNCDEGGCPRGLLSHDELAHKAPFDGIIQCTAVHAEMNAIRKFKANHGMADERAVLYSTREPCHLCLPQIRAIGFLLENIVWRK